MKKKFPKIKKDLRSFLLEEEGRISKKSVVNTGLALISAAAFFSGQPKGASAFFEETYHQGENWWPLCNYDYNYCHTNQPNHISSTPIDHCSHGSHASHGSHSNCGCGGAFGTKGCW